MSPLVSTLIMLSPLVSFVAGSFVWFLLIQRVPYRYLWRAYYLGSLIPMAAAILTTLVVVAVFS